MKHEIVAVFDKKALTYALPFFSSHITVALRMFRAEVNRDDGKNMLALYPEDYDLVYLGTFDDEGGVFDLKLPPAVITRAADLINVKS